jgi:hypothetical protein
LFRHAPLTLGLRGPRPKTGREFLCSLQQHPARISRIA